MKTSKRFLGFLVSIFLAVGCVGTKSTDQDIQSPLLNNSLTSPELSQKITGPLSVTLELDSQPRLNHPFTATVTLASLVSAPRALARLVVPENVTVVGPAEWTGSLVAKQPVSIAFSIEIDKPGQIAVRAEGVGYTKLGASFDGSAVAFISIDNNGAEVNPEPFVETVDSASPVDSSTQILKAPVDAPILPPITHIDRDSKLAILRSSDVGGGNSLTAQSGAVTIYGYWYYKDVTGQDKPVRTARVEIWEDDLVIDRLLTTVYTNGSGYYSATVPNTDDFGGVDIYVKVFATDDYSVHVTDALSRLRYSVSSTVNDLPDGSHNMGAYSIAAPHGWYIFDVLANKAWLELKQKVGWDNDYNLLVMWPDPLSTGYSTVADVLKLVNGDRWDEDVFLHEYGHFVMDKIYPTFPPTPNCGPLPPHGWGSDSSLGCAWVEGWATFLQAAIQGDSKYVDTIDRNYNFDLEPPDPSVYSDKDEASVLASLWDIFDDSGSSEPHDQLSSGLTKIWNVVYGYKPTDAYGFWNSWRSSGQGNDCYVSRIFRYHEINVDDLCPPPGTPTGLSSVAFSSSQINLSWTDNSSDESSFKIERSPDGSSSWTQVGNLGAGATSYSNTGLSACTTYYYRVRAYRSVDAKYSAYSNISSAKTMGCSIAAPSNLAANATSASQINLSWSDNSSDETNFKIERSPDGSSSWTEVGSVGAGITSFSNTGLSACTTYYYHVRAYRSGDNAYSAASNVANAKTTGCTLAAPSNLAASAVSFSQINLGWSDNSSDETNFKIERSPNGSSSWTEVGSVGAGVTTYSNTSLSACTTYYYRVRAYRSGDTTSSTPSNIVNATTAGCTVTAPSDLSAVAASSSQVDLSWADNSSDETNFKIERSPNGSSSWTEVGSVGAGVTSYSNIGLAACTTYYYRVRAYRSGDGTYSTYSNVNNAATTGCTLNAPTGLSVVTASASQINLTWADNSSDESSFKIERSLDGATGWSEVGSVGAAVNSYSNNSLAACTTYYYRVRAYRAADTSYSAYSNVGNATTTGCTLGAPSALSAVAASSSQINLTWADNSSDESSFKIERSPDGSTGWTQVASVGAAVTSYSNTGLAACSVYYYRVRSYRAGDAAYSAYSNAAYANTKGCTLVAPTGLSAVTASASQINLSWTDKSLDETNFRMERSADGSTGWVEVGTVGAGVTNYSNSGLAACTTYYYRVRAYRSGDSTYSAYSNVTNATTIGCSLAAPAGLSAVASSSSQINLGWTDNSSDETSFKIERSPDGSTGWAEVDSVAAGVASYSNTGLTACATYYYRVRAYRSGDAIYSAYSNVSNATTIGCSLAAPTGLSAVTASASQINLNWTDNSSDETNFKIERSPDGSTGWAEAGSVGAAASTYSNTGLTACTIYYYRVRAYRSGDSTYSAYSNVTNATTIGCSLLTISGNAGVANASLSYPGGSGVADGDGFYSFSVSTGWSGAVTPMLAGYTFTPASRTYANVSSDQLNQDYTAYAGAITQTYESEGAYDGWILESTETSGKGGTKNSSATTIVLGDDASNRQYRSVLSFNTANLPEDAVIHSAVVKVKRSGIVIGTNPFTVLGKLVVDIRTPYFGPEASLQLGDFNASAAASQVGAFNNVPSAGWYRATLNTAGLARINKSGATQLRLRFTKDDNNNYSADLMRFFSGNSSTYKPLLEITYTKPVLASTLNEHFDDQELFNNPTWTVNNPAYAVADGVLSADGAIIDQSDRYLNGFTTPVSIAASDYLEMSFRGKLKSTGNPQTGRGIQLVLGTNGSGAGYAINIQKGYTNGFPTNKYSISLTYGDGNDHLTDVILTSYEPNYDQFYNVKATRSGGAWKLYVDGALIGSQTAPGALPQVDTVNLWTVGSIAVDDIVVTRVSSEPPVQQDSLEEHFTDGEVANNPTWTVTDAAYAVTDGVLHADGLIIDQSDRYLNGFTTPVSIAATDYLEMSFRGKLKSTGNPQAGRGIQLLLGNNTTSAGYAINIQKGYTNGFPTNKYSISLTYGDGNDHLNDVILTSYAPNYDQFYNVKAVRSGGVWSLYVDGTLVGSQAEPAGFIQADTLNLWTVGSIAVDDIVVRTAALEEHFDDGEVANNPTWTVHNNSYTVSGGVLHVNGAIIDQSDRYLNGFTTPVSVAASDYLEMSFRGMLKSTGSPQAGRGIQLVVGYSGSPNSFAVNIQNGYTNGFSTNKHCLSVTFGNGNLYDVVTTSYAPNFDQYYNVKAVRSGGVWSLYVDGTLIGSQNSPGALAQLDTVQLWTVGSVAVDDLVVKTTP